METRRSRRLGAVLACTLSLALAGCVSGGIYSGSYHSHSRYHGHPHSWYHGYSPRWYRGHGYSHSWRHGHSRHRYHRRHYGYGGWYGRW